MAKQRAGVAYLYFNGVASRDLALALLAAGRVVRRKVVRGGIRTEKFLPAVADFLRGSRPSGIIVAQGGSFSQTRLVCAIANALAYGWGIKVASVPSGLTVEEVAAKLPKLRWQRLVLPKYSGPGVAITSGASL